MGRLFILLSLLILPRLSYTQYISIHDIQGEQAASPYNNQTVTTKGAVTGVFKDGYFIRESTAPWESIYIYDPGRIPMPEKGDTVSLTGVVSEYYEWTEIKSVSELNIISSSNPIPEPVVLSVEEIDESMESCLLKIESAVCTNTNLGYGEWEVDDGTGKLAIDDMGVVFQPESGQEYILTGNLIYSFGAYKLEPRDAEDIIIDAPVYFLMNPYASEINKNQISIHWQTNVESSTEAFYGLSPDLEIGHLSSDISAAGHELIIEGLEPATPVYAQLFSVLEGDTARSELLVFITQSESSGMIIPSFNRTPTNLIFTGDPGLFTDNIPDTIIKYIDKAESTLDMALYDFTSHSPDAGDYNSGIEEAIYRAKDRGVQLRLITDADVAASAPESGYIQRLDVSHDGIMHHKFIIIDSEDPLNSWVLTGSTNPNYNNMVLDFNNLLAIQDQSLARVYEMEFEEIWGSSGPSPDIGLSKSGNTKTDNTPHSLNIDGRLVEVYFSPSDRTTFTIAERMDSAKTEIEFAVMAFTENTLGDALVAAHKKGITVEGIIDYVEYSGSEFNYLVNEGIPVLDYKNPDQSEWPSGTTLHHKFAVIDRETPDAMVITGSHNWTASAQSINDENTLIIHDQEIASEFSMERNRISDWLMNPPIRPHANNDYFELYEESQLELDILGNDETTGPFTVLLIGSPGKGIASLTEESSVLYEPDSNFTESTDTLFYSLNDQSYGPFKDTAMVVLRKMPTGMDIIKSGTAIRVYPNPSDGIFYISYDEQLKGLCKVRIISLSGKIVLMKDTDLTGNNLEMDTSSLQPGSFILILENEGKRYYSKLILR